MVRGKSAAASRGGVTTTVAAERRDGRGTGSRGDRAASHRNVAAYTSTRRSVFVGRLSALAGLLLVTTPSEGNGMADMPSGTVTFLFTDLEGSTRLWEEHPEAMVEALARHDEIVRTSITSHDGRIVKGTGDGFHAVFVDATQAVDAAVDAQRRLGR